MKAESLLRTLSASLLRPHVVAKQHVLVAHIKLAIVNDRMRPAFTQLAGEAERAFEFVDTSINCLKTSGGHLHFFSHIKSDTKAGVVPISEAHIRNLFSKYNFEIEHTQIVRDVAPRIYQTVTDLIISK